MDSSSAAAPSASRLNDGRRLDVADPLQLATQANADQRDDHEDGEQYAHDNGENGAPHSMPIGMTLEIADGDQPKHECNRCREAEDGEQSGITSDDGPGRAADRQQHPHGWVVADVASWSYWAFVSQRCIGKRIGPRGDGDGVSTARARPTASQELVRDVGRLATMRTRKSNCHNWSFFNRCLEAVQLAECEVDPSSLAVLRAPELVSHHLIGRNQDVGSLSTIRRAFEIGAPAFFLSVRRPPVAASLGALVPSSLCFPDSKKETPSSTCEVPSPVCTWSVLTSNRIDEASITVDFSSSR